MKLIFATHNIHKFKELQALLFKSNIDLLCLNDFPNIPDIKETGTSFIENATIKVKAIFKILKLPVIADDSGLEVDYLQRRPGIFSKRYAGHNATDLDRINKLLKELHNIPWENRKAQFVCAMVYFSGKKIFNVSGYCNGFISEKPLGNNGFGYDPVFYLPDLNKTMAQLSAKQKNNISHRSNALKKIKKILIQHY